MGLIMELINFKHYHLYIESCLCVNNKLIVNYDKNKSLSFQIIILRKLVLLPMVNGLMRLNIYLSNYLRDYVIRTNSKEFGMPY